MLKKPFVWLPASGWAEALLCAAHVQQLQVLMNHVNPIQEDWGSHREGVINSLAAARSLANGIMNYAES